MSSKHSPEPWVAERGDFVVDANGATVGAILVYSNTAADTDRIIACVNACAGIPADELHMIKLWRGSYHKNTYREGE